MIKEMRLVTDLSITAKIYVDPNNENRLYSIFTYVNVSEDGGKSLSPN